MNATNRWLRAAIRRRYKYPPSHNGGPGPKVPPPYDNDPAWRRVWPVPEANARRAELRNSMKTSGHLILDLTGRRADCLSDRRFLHAHEHLLHGAIGRPAWRS